MPKKNENKNTGERENPAQQEPGIPRENWLKLNSYWLSWAIPTALVVIAWLFGLFGAALDGRIDSRLGEQLDRRDKQLTANIDAKINSALDLKLNPINDAIHQIRERLVRLEAKAGIPSPIKDLSEANIQALPEFLPQLRKTVSSSTDKPDKATLQLIAEKLKTIPEGSKDYWPTVLEFLQYSSSALAKNVPPPGQDVTTVSQLTLRAYPGEKITLTGVTIRFDGSHIEDLTFRNSRIIFTENPTTMKNVTFIDCLFEMPATEMPSPYLKRAAQLLIASSDPSNATIPSL